MYAPYYKVPNAAKSRITESSGLRGDNERKQEPGSGFQAIGPSMSNGGEVQFLGKTISLIIMGNSRAALFRPWLPRRGSLNAKTFGVPGKSHMLAFFIIISKSHSPWLEF